MPMKYAVCMDFLWPENGLLIRKGKVCSLLCFVYFIYRNNNKGDDFIYELWPNVIAITLKQS